MTPDRHAQPHRVDVQVRRLAPLTDDRIEDRPDDAGARALFAVIVAEPFAPPHGLRKLRVPRVWKRAALVATAAAAAALVALVVLAVSSPSTPRSSAATRPVTLHTASGGQITGRIPNDDFTEGRVQWAKVPSYIPVYSGGLRIGYVMKSEVDHPPIEAGPLVKAPTLPGTRLCTTGGIGVYNSSHVLIGYIDAGTGFVRLGAVPPCLR